MKMEKKEEQFGSLFGTIPLISEEHLDAILSAMTKEDSTYYLVEAIKAAYNRGAFTIGEVEVISKAIRIGSTKI
jgi:hypothetical protein